MNASQRPPPLFPTGVPIGPQGSPDRQASPQSALNLGSNNPFRNRALSPSSATAPSLARPERPTSTNPFLDDFDVLAQSAPAPVMSTPPENQDTASNTRDLFENLSLNPAQSNGSRPAPPRPNPGSLKGPSSGRDLPSRERSERRPRNPELDIFADPPSKPRSGSGRERERRPRRNSESSIIERTPKLLDPDDDRRRRERRRRDRETRHRDGKSRSKKNYQLDIIDKLDVTSIYGTGMFHHDGPFDACNPNRNRRGLRAAPMQAFPKDSSNMAMGRGSGPNNPNIDLNLVYGTTAEGYNDFGSTGTVHGRKTEGNNFDPTKRIEPVHGWESAGLGTSTFLEGAPASREAMRRESETEAQIVKNGGGIQRKKSLAQRIRGGVNSRTPSSRVISPERLDTARATSSHGSMSRGNDKNPSPQDYDDAWDRKGSKIQVAEETRDIPDVGRARSASSPKQSTGLDRKFTNERSNSGLDEGRNTGGGFINRMKSLRKPKPERRMSDD